MTAEVSAQIAPQHRSRVLDQWIAGRDGGMQRAGIEAIGENSFVDGVSPEDLASVLGLQARSAAGVAVTPASALQVTTIYACVSLVSGTVASMPLGVYERSGKDRQKSDHEYWWLFNEQACEQWTSAAAWEYLISSKLLYGDGFARLLRPSLMSSRVIGFEPLHPLSVHPFKGEGRRVRYRVTPSGEPAYTLDSADILHFPSLGFDGLRSPSAITYAARNAVGTSIAAQDHAAQFFNGGATFDYALKTAQKLNPAQLKELKASLMARAQSGGRGPLLLSGGLEPAQLSVNSKDAEILATRQFGVEDMCRPFGVPPYMVGHTVGNTVLGSSIEQQGMGFRQHTMQRHLTPVAQELNRKLWPVRQKYFVEHITAALERGDLKSRNEAYRIAMGRAGEEPWMNAEEVRRLENLGPNPDLKMNGGADAQTTTATR